MNEWMHDEKLDQMIPEEALLNFHLPFFLFFLLGVSGTPLAIICLSAFPRTGKVLFLKGS